MSVEFNNVLQDKEVIVSLNFGQRLSIFHRDPDDSIDWGILAIDGLDETPSVTYYKVDITAGNGQLRSRMQLKAIGDWKDGKTQTPQCEGYEEVMAVQWVRRIDSRKGALAIPTQQPDGSRSMIRIVPTPIIVINPPQNH